MRGKLALMAVSLALSLVAVELALRWLAPPVTTGVGTVRAPKAVFYGWALPPRSELEFINPDTGQVHHFHTNSQGWKDVEHTVAKPEGAFRVLVLGDSNTYGIVPLEQLYTRHLERILKERTRLNVEVITIGLGGWGTDHALEAMMREGLAYRPDVVIYQFCRNDLTDNLQPDETCAAGAIQCRKPFQYRCVDGRLVRLTRELPVEPESRAVRVKRLLLRSALVYNLNLARRRLLASAARPAEEAGRSAPTPPHEAERREHWWDRFPVDPTSPYYPWAVPQEESASMGQAWELLAALLARMKSAASEAGAAFVVFSEEGDAAMRLWEIKLKRLHTDGDSDHVDWHGRRYPADFWAPLRRLAGICKAAAIPLVEPKRAYGRYDYDPHPNALGNLHMAEDIADFLIERQMLPGLADAGACP